MFVPLLVSAQEAVEISTVEVSLLPEYDRTDMLVIYRITLSPQVSFPAEVTIRIPAAAGVPNAVASGDPDGSLMNLKYDQQPAGAWSLLTFTSTSPDIQIEYYDPNLEIDGITRYFEYHWPGDHSVGRMSVQVQQPLGATDMSISPNLGSGVQGGDGMIYYTADVGSLESDQTFVITMNYLKVSDDLSTSDMPVQFSAPIETATPSWFTLESALPFILGFLGLALIIGGGVWYWQSGRNKKSNKTQRSRHKPAAERSTNASETSHNYCHQCGKRAQPGDRFCRTCGSELRSGG